MEKDLQYRIGATPDGFDRGMKSAEQSAAAFERELAKLERQQAKVHQAMDLLGKGMVTGGAAIAAGLGLAAKAAIDWESAWTGVAKVVDGTPEQMAALEEEIRGLTNILPQSHAEIAGVAEAAGQLGIKRQDIAEFTKVMVMMGTATNISSQDAATSLARLMNIMQTAPENVSRLASTVVALGNAGASTEAEIVSMALRIAGAGHTIGLTEAQVLAFSGALSDVGIEAEAGGSAISTVFIKIETAVRKGGKELDAFAAVAGMSAAQFKRAYQQDAAGAIATFVEGLGRIQRSGGDVFATLESLEITEIRQRDAMLRLAGAGDLLRGSLDNANEGWSENEALLAEAERRYGTTEAKMQMARNSVVNLAIDIGQVLLPVVGGLADGISALANFFGDLPGPVKAVVTILGGLAAAVLLIGGTALITVPKIAAFKAASEQLANSQGKLAAMVTAANGAMSKAGSFLGGPWGIAIGVAIAAITAFGVAHGQSDNRVKEFIDTLDEETGAITLNTRAKAVAEIQNRGLQGAIESAGIEMSTFVDAVMGEQAAIEEVNAALDAYNEKSRLDNMIGADVRVSNVKNAMTELNGEVERAQAEWEATQDAIHGADTEMERLDPATRQLAEGLGLTADEAEGAADALDELDQEMKALLDRVFGLTDAQSEFESALDDLTAAIQRQREANVEGAGGFDLNTEAGRENYEIIKGLISTLPALYQQTLLQTNSTTDAAAAVDEATARFEELAAQLGIDITQVEGYNDVVAAIERDVQTRIEAQTATAILMTQGYIAWLNAIPREVRTRMIVEQQTARGGEREFASGGPVWGPMGVDKVPARLTAGEFVMKPEAAQQNRAVLEAMNAGARIPLNGAGGGMGGGGATHNHNLYVYPQTADFGIAELQLVMAQQAYRERAGRAG